MKKCNTCQEEKSFEEFSKDKHISDGHKNKCKMCEKKSRDAKQGRSGKKNINNFKDAQSWLNENFPQYEIVDFGPPVRIFNRKKNLQFDYSSFSRFKEKLTKFPKREFGIDKQNLQDKIKNVFSEKYGGPSPFSSDVVRKKSTQTIKEKYGVENVMHNKDFVLQNMTKHVFDGKTVLEITEDSGVSYSHFINILNSQGLDSAMNLKKGITSIESFLMGFLNENNIHFRFNEWNDELSIRPDFLLPKYNLAIELDGLRWHCDLFCEQKDYHAKRSEKYRSIKFDSLFFRSDEIAKSPNIVKSIILNKLKLNREKIFARKCNILSLTTEESNSFFEENHLMGAGSGRTYALKFNNEIVSAIRVKWISKEERLLDISRFCTKNNISIVGGYSRLIKHVEKIEQPKIIQTFVDLRYGDGSYLENFGFQFANCDLSFQWTDFKNTYHRMVFPGNSGYDHGLHKIWDCGQAKWIKNV